MAVSSANVNVTANLETKTVTATADGDTSITITHALGASPQIVLIEPILQAPAALSLWAVTGRSANDITLTKGTGAGSGNGAAQIRVHIARPHSIMM